MLALLLGCSSSPWDGVEICNGLDDDRDGLVDARDPSLLRGELGYVDRDGDGWGTREARVMCPYRTGLVERSGDCDDQDPDRNPDAVEVCGGGDDDCDGLEDAEDDSLDLGSAWFVAPDRDGDGWGAEGSGAWVCEEPTLGVSVEGDCDDHRADVNPGATEHCDGVDEDCDPRTPDGCLDDVLVDDLRSGRIRTREGSGRDHADVLLAADADGDGRPELVLRGSSTTWIASAPVGDASIDDLAFVTEPGHLPDDRLGGVSDIDGDGIEDLLVINEDGRSSDRDAWFTGVVRGPLADGLGEPVVTIEGGDDGVATLLTDRTALGEGGFACRIGGKTSTGIAVVRGRRLGPVRSHPDLHVRLGAEDTEVRSLAGSDLDGDGTDELIAALKTTHGGRVAILVGPTSAGNFDDADHVIEGALGRSQGSVAAVGDVDADGLDDLGVVLNDDGRGLVFRDALTAGGPADAWLQALPPAAWRWDTLGPAGDLDGDGASEVRVSSQYSSVAADQGGYAVVLLGGTGGAVHAADALVAFGAASGDHLGRGVSGPADLDGDGIPDLAFTGTDATWALWVVSGARVMGAR